VEGPQLGCMAAVRSALAILPAGHPEVALVTFVHSCNDVGFSAGDCLVQLFGVMTVTFVDGSPPIRMGMTMGSQPRILSGTVPTGPTPVPGGTAPAG
jgi:hypothetical protein